MIVRRCAQNHDVVIHKNTKPGMRKMIAMSDGTKQELTYPSSYNYFLVVDGSVVQRSNSFETIENAYVDKCTEIHGDSHGRIDIIHHKIINNQVVDR